MFTRHARRDVVLLLAIVAHRRPGLEQFQERTPLLSSPAKRCESRSDVQVCSTPFHRSPYGSAPRNHVGASAGRYAVGVKNASHPPATEAQERWTVDGIEDSPRGPLARLEREDGTTFDLPLRLLPQPLREGDLLAVQDGPDGVTLRILVAETMERRETAQAQLEALNNAESDLQDDDGEITV